MFFPENSMLLRIYEVQLNYKIVFFLSTLRSYTFCNDKLSIIYHLLSGVYLLVGLSYFFQMFTVFFFISILIPIF